MHFCILCRNSRRAAKDDRKKYLENSRHLILQVPWGSKILSKWLYFALFPRHVVLRFMQKFKMTTKKWQENEFGEKTLVDSADTLGFKNFVEIAPSHSVSEINGFLHLTHKFKRPPKMAGKHFWRKRCHFTLQITCGSKILSKSLYLTPFLR